MKFLLFPAVEPDCTLLKSDLSNAGNSASISSVFLRGRHIAPPWSVHKWAPCHRTNAVYDDGTNSTFSERNIKRIMAYASGKSRPLKWVELEPVDEALLAKLLEFQESFNFNHYFVKFLQLYAFFDFCFWTDLKKNYKPNFFENFSNRLLDVDGPDSLFSFLAASTKIICANEINVKKQNNTNLNSAILVISNLFTHFN